jgi:putative ABC transport system permease protein
LCSRNSWRNRRRTTLTIVSISVSLCLLGVLKTLGFTRGTILSLILGQAVAIATIGGALGVVLASFLCRVVRQGPAFSDDLKHLAIQPPVVLTCLIVAATIGLISAFIPAWNASRISIVDALRSTE